MRQGQHPVPTGFLNSVADRRASGRVHSRTAVVAVVLLTTLALTGCRDEDPGQPAGTISASSTGPCDYGRSDDEEAGGPLQRQSNSMTFAMRYLAPGKVQDATVIVLVNSGRSPVILDSVDLVPDPHASPLRRLGSSIAAPSVTQRVGPPRSVATAPLRATASSRSPRGIRRPCLPCASVPRILDTAPRFSRNNSVNVHYRDDFRATLRCGLPRPVPVPQPALTARPGPTCGNASSPRLHRCRSGARRHWGE